MAAAAANKNQDKSPRGRKRADKRIAIQLVLDNVAEHCQGEHWSNQKIADHIGGVGKDLVNEMRKAMDANLTDPPSEKPMRELVGSDGKNYRDKSSVKAPESAPTASMDGGHWGDVALEEYLDADDYTWEQLKNVGVKTTGQLLQRLAAGDRFNLQPGDLKKIREQAEKVRDGSKAETKKKVAAVVEPPRPAPAENPLAYFLRVHFKEIVRTADEVGRAFPKMRGSLWANKWKKWAADGEVLAKEGLRGCKP